MRDNFDGNIFNANGSESPSFDTSFDHFATDCSLLQVVLRSWEARGGV